MRVLGYECYAVALGYSHRLKNLEKLQKSKRIKVRTLTLCELDKLMDYGSN